MQLGSLRARRRDAKLCLMVAPAIQQDSSENMWRHDGAGTCLLSVIVRLLTSTQDYKGSVPSLLSCYSLTVRRCIL